MKCPDCGVEGCDGSCQDAIFGIEEDEQTFVGRQGVQLEDLRRLWAEGAIEVELDDWIESEGGPAEVGFDLDLDDLIEQGTPRDATPREPLAALDDPFAGPLVMLDGTLAEEPAHAPSFAPPAPFDPLDPQPAGPSAAPSRASVPAAPRRAPAALASANIPQGPLDARGVRREPNETARWGQGNAEKSVDGPLSPPSAVGAPPVQEVRRRHLDVAQPRAVTLAVVMGRFLVAQRVIVTRPLTIGREPNLGLVLNNPSVSRRHCELRHRAGVDTICDLGASNGTLLDGRPIVEAELRPGNVIGVGKFYLIYEPSPAQLETLAAHDPGAGRYGIGRGAADDPTPVPLQAIARAYLIPLDAEDNATEWIALDRPLLVFGTGADADIAISGTLVGKRHATISRQATGFVVAVEGWNRISINGKGTKRALLEEGDVLKVGRESFRFSRR